MDTLVEQRSDTRTKLSWPVSVWFPEMNRFFNGRSCNISKSGVLLNVPMTMPVRQGSIVEINFPRTEALAKEKGQFARIKFGKVVRVDNKNAMKDASVSVAVHFE